MTSESTLHTITGGGAVNDLSAHERTPEPLQLRGWRLGVLIMFVTLAILALAVFSAVSSYESLRSGAEAHQVPLPAWNPIGFDGGLAVVIVLNIVLVLLREPIWWLRWVARGLAVGTVAGNMAAGWPDPIGIGYRVAAPVIIIILVEAGQTLLLRRYKRDDPYLAARRAEREKRRADRIPLSRWILDRGQTWQLYRRMKLWGITSYRDAIDMEQRRLRAMHELAEHFGTASWQSLAPSDLVWMLDTGIHMDDALQRVEDLTSSNNSTGPEGGPGGGSKGGPGGGSRGGPGGGSKGRSGAGRTGRGTPPAEDVSVEARALALLLEDSTMTAPQLRAKLAEAGMKVSDGYARKLVRRLTAQDRVTASPQDRPRTAGGPAVRDRSQDRTARRPE